MTFGFNGQWSVSTYNVLESRLQTLHFSPLTSFSFDLPFFFSHQAEVREGQSSYTHDQQQGGDYTSSYLQAHIHLSIHSADWIVYHSCDQLNRLDYSSHFLSLSALRITPIQLQLQLNPSF